MLLFLQKLAICRSDKELHHKTCHKHINRATMAVARPLLKPSLVWQAGLLLAPARMSFPRCCIWGCWRPCLGVNQPSILIITHSFSHTKPQLPFEYHISFLIPQTKIMDTLPVSNGDNGHQWQCYSFLSCSGFHKLHVLLYCQLRHLKPSQSYLKAHFC